MSFVINPIPPLEILSNLCLLLLILNLKFFQSPCFNKVRNYVKLGTRVKTNKYKHDFFLSLRPFREESLCVGKYGGSVRVRERSAAEKYGGTLAACTALHRSLNIYYPLFFSVSLEQYYLNQ